MDGAEVMAFSLTSVPNALNTLLAKTGQSMDQIDLFVFHQANRKLPGLPGPDAADALGLAITQAHAGLTLARLGAASPLSRKTSGRYRDGRGH
ncbi:hypothetical protein P3G55_24960, partial [Leptospira sp. 96542]|nr:hypothetical protein [Leptospira sp. 96542]